MTSALFTDGGAKRVCKWCGERYRPRVEDQRYCGRCCRMQAKAAEGRAANGCECRKASESDSTSKVRRRKDHGDEAKAFEQEVAQSLPD